MDRRYQVFVSSTFLDLQEERAAVVTALLSLEAFPAGMEQFPAADDDAWTLIKRVIDESDYYLLVIGGKYGSIDPETKLSYTEKEYDYAVSRNKPVLAFLHGEPEKIELGKSEGSEETREKLSAFRQKVEAEKHVKYWVNRDDLQGKIAMSFGSFRQQYPAEGWIRGGTQTSAESLGELNELRKELAELERQLESARTQRPADTEDLAQGSDLCEFEPVATVIIQIGGTSWRTQSFALTIHAPITWDEIFAALGPDLLDEAEEKAMSRAFGEWLHQRFGEATLDASRRGLKEAGRDLDSVKSISIKLEPADFGTLIIQLRALGLITKSERKRSVSDSGTYWTLTPYGSEHLTSLRAVRRKSAESGAEAEESVPAGKELKFEALDVGPTPDDDYDTPF